MLEFDTPPKEQNQRSSVVGVVVFCVLNRKKLLSLFGWLLRRERDGMEHRRLFMKCVEIYVAATGIEI